LNVRASTLLVFLPLFACSACSDDGSNPNAPRDTGVADTGSAPADVIETDGGAVLRPFAPPTNPGPRGILFTASGEVLALGGYAFPPATIDDAAFVDGWEVKFTRVLVTIDRITLSENPDKSAGDPSRIDAVVAEVNGPFAVDLHKGGPLAGKGGTDEQAVALAAVGKKSDGSDFDTTKRYAFGFDTIRATSTAKNVNLDAVGLEDYKEMIANEWVVLYVGTATFKGGTSCTSPSTTYDFTKLPTTVKFRLGFQSPTSYVNCQNPDNDPASAFAGEEHQRGVQPNATKPIVAQVTIHTDHPFWEGIEHDSPPHFDPIAAHYLGEASPTAKTEDFIGVDFTAFKDKAGTPLPWRSCVSSYTAPAGTVSFDAKTLPVNPSGAPDKALRDYRDYMTYSLSTQGHLNSDGLCYVKRNYPSPP